MGAELAAAVEKLPDRFDLVACATPVESEREAFAKRFGAAVHADFDALLAVGSLDAVLLATPHSLHAGQIRAACAAGKHVFCEKPLSLTRETALQAAAAADRNGVVLAVGHNRRFSAGALELRRRLDAAAFGTVLHVEGHFSSPSALAYAPTAWRAQRSEAPAGALASMGLHVLDIMTWLLGPISRVACLSRRRAVAVDVDDTTAVLLDFASGATGTLGTLFAVPLNSYLRVCGTGGIARVDEDFGRFTWHGRDGAGPAPVELPEVDTVVAELDAFARAVTGEAAFPVTPDEAVRNVAVLEAIATSAARDGAWTEPGLT